MGQHIFQNTDSVKNVSSVTGETTTDALNNLAGLISAEDLWDRIGTTIEPKVANDNVDIGSGNFLGGGLSINTGDGSATITGSDFILNAGSTLAFITDDTVENGIHISGVGNVGIGIAAPEKKLHVIGDILLNNNDLFLIKDTGGTNRTVITINTSNQVIFGPASLPAGGETILRGAVNENLIFEIGTSEIARFDSNGNLGINTVTSLAKLDIVVDDTDNVSVLRLSNNDVTNNPDTLVINNITTGADLNINGLLTIEDSISVIDDGTINLPAGVSGWLYCWEGIEYLHAKIDIDATVTIIAGSANTVNTDTDGNLCVFDGGTNAVIKNRLGETKTIRYFFKYS